MATRKKKPTWTEKTPGQWVHKTGYTLTRVGRTMGWRLCDPHGEYLVTQLELPPGVPLIVDWADQYISYLEALPRNDAKRKTKA